MKKPLEKKRRIECAYYFSDPELNEIGADLARAQAALEQLRADKANNAKFYSSEIAAAEKKTSEIARKRRERYELRDIECEVLYIYPAGVKRIMRPDTAEIVLEEPISDEERQAEIPFDESGPKQ